MASPLDNPAFRRWFGQSKVVDESGEPLVVYHGTSDQYKFDVFKDAKGKHSVFWFSGDPVTASTYAGGYMRAPRKDDPVLRPDLSERFLELYARSRDRNAPDFSDEERAEFAAISRSLPSGGVYRVYLRIENPLVIDAASSKSWKAVPYAGRDGQVSYASTDDVAQWYLYGHEGGHRKCGERCMWGREDIPHDMRGVGAGYDGLIIYNIEDSAYNFDGRRGTVYAVPSAGQIKSASLNDGTYDIDDLSIVSNPRRRTSKRKSSRRKSSRRRTSR